MISFMVVKVGTRYTPAMVKTLLLQEVMVEKSMVVLETIFLWVVMERIKYLEKMTMT